MSVPGQDSTRTAVAAGRSETGATLRRVMAEYPSGVVIVTSESDGHPVGMACNSFTSVSLEPQLVSFCIAHTSSTWPQIRADARFCINIMSSDHEEVTRTFSRRNVDRFAAGSWRRRPGGPGLCDAVAWLDCRIWGEHSAGDHTIVIGEVTSMDIHAEATTPLVFWRGGYVRLFGGHQHEEGDVADINWLTRRFTSLRPLRQMRSWLTLSSPRRQRTSQETAHDGDLT
jgi:flavin reductase (DIM6/NTAB) family NADH-FMN oxidoreductase RutF